MERTQEAVELRKLIIELSSVGTDGADLDDLIERLISVLKHSPEVDIIPAGVIFLSNPRNELVQIAQFGLNNPTETSSFTDALDGLVPEIKSHAYLTSLSQEMGESWTGVRDNRLLILPLYENDKNIGVIVLCSEPDWEPAVHTLDFLTDIAHVSSSVVSRYLVNETLGIRELELEEARADAIRRLGAASEYRDNETGMHVMRMTHYSAAIAKALGMSEEEREQLIITAPMHDVGKIGISDAILLKPGKLTEEEFEVMKTHTDIGGKLLKGKDSLINSAREIALTHHEHWDGSGYPLGLSGEQIPLFGRICSIADAFDALVSDRPYKDAWEVNDAVEWIKSESGRKFDPGVVTAFLDSLPDILRIRELYRDDIIDPNQILHLPEVASSPYEWVSWDDSLSVGIDVIDEHHKYLIDLVNDLHKVITEKCGSREVARVLNALGQYAQIHFRAEEKMMEHHGYSAINRQMHQHQHFERKVKAFYDELHVNPLTAQHDVLTFLRDWLVKHIVVEDGQLNELTRNKSDSRQS